MIFKLRLSVSVNLAKERTKKICVQYFKRRAWNKSGIAARSRRATKLTNNLGHVESWSIKYSPTFFNMRWRNSSISASRQTNAMKQRIVRKGRSMKLRSYIFSLFFFFWTRLFSQSWLNEAGERNSNFGQWFWTAIPNPVSRRPAAEANTLSTRIFRLVESFCTPNWPGRTFINLNLNRLFGGCPLVDKRRYYFREERTFPSARVTSDRDRRPIEFLLVVRFPHERQSPRNVEYLAQRQFDAIEFLGSTLIKSFN